MEERATRTAKLILVGFDFNISEAAVEDYVSRLVLAALRVQREEALEEAAKECAGRSEAFKLESEKYHPYSRPHDENREYSEYFKEVAETIRALKTQTGGGDGN